MVVIQLALLSPLIIFVLIYVMRFINLFFNIFEPKISSRNYLNKRDTEKYDDLADYAMWLEQ